MAFMCRRNSSRTYKSPTILISAGIIECERKMALYSFNANARCWAAALAAPTSGALFSLDAALPAAAGFSQSEDPHAEEVDEQDDLSAEAADAVEAAEAEPGAEEDEPAEKNREDATEAGRGTDASAGKGKEDGFAGASLESCRNVTEGQRPNIIFCCVDGEDMETEKEKKCRFFSFFPLPHVPFPSFNLVFPSFCIATEQQRRRVQILRVGTDRERPWRRRFPLRTRLM